MTIEQRYQKLFDELKSNMKRRDEIRREMESLAKQMQEKGVI